MAGSATIGALRVSLGLDSAQFQQGLANAQGGLSQFAKVATVGLVAVAAAAAAALSGLTSGIKSSLNAADDMNKAAQKTGIAAEELSKLKYAADLSGVSFEGLQTSIGRLSKNIAMAAAGSGQGAKAFQALGISVQNSDGSIKSASAVLQELAAKFATMPDGAVKTALAMQLMGRSGAEMIPMLNGGKAALQEMAAEAEAFGIVIDGPTAAAAERFNDGLSKLGYAASGLFTRLTAELAPALTAIVEYFVDAAKESNGFASTIQSVASTAVDAALWIMDAWHNIGLVFPALEVAVTGFGLVVQKIAADVAGFIVGIVDSVVSGINTVIAKSNEILGTSTALVDPLGSSEWAKNIEDDTLRAQHAFATARLKMEFALNQPLPSEGIRKAIEDIKAGKGDIEATADAAVIATDAFASGGKKAAGGLSEAAKAMRELKAEGQRVFEETRTPLEKYNMELDKLNRLLQAGAIDWDTYQRAIAQAQEEFDKADDKSNELADTLASEFTNAFSSIIDGTKSAKDAFADLAKSLMNMFLNKALQSLFSNLFNLLPGFGGGAATGGGGSIGGLYGAPEMSASDMGAVAGNNVTVINNTGQPSRTREADDGRGGRRIEVVVGEMVGSETARPGSAMNSAVRSNFNVTPRLVGR